jgi:hypothetical protein
LTYHEVGTGAQVWASDAVIALWKFELAPPPRVCHIGMKGVVISSRLHRVHRFDVNTGWVALNRPAFSARGDPAPLEIGVLRRYQ